MANPNPPPTQSEPLVAIGRDHLAAIACALDCAVESIADRAALSAATRVLYGLEPLGPARTVVDGQEFDLTDVEADQVADFIAGLITARDLHNGHRIWGATGRRMAELLGALCRAAEQVGEEHFLELLGWRLGSFGRECV